MCFFYFFEALSPPKSSQQNASSAVLASRLGSVPLHRRRATPRPSATLDFGQACKAGLLDDTGGALSDMMESPMQASGVVRLAWSWRLGLWRGAGAGGGSARAPAFCGISACTGDGCAVGPRRVCVHGNFCKRRLRQHGRVLCPSGLRVHGVCSYSVRGSFGSGFERFAFGRRVDPSFLNAEMLGVCAECTGRRQSPPTWGSTALKRVGKRDH